MSTIKKLLPFIVIIILVILIKNNITFLLNYQKSGSALSSLEKNLATEQKKNQYLSERLYYVKTDKFVQNQAQNKLGMLKEGEFFVIAPTAAPLNSPTQTFNSEPNWRRWWNLFF
jgi:hypothetical protein